MRFCSLGSGSRGNAYVVDKGDTTLLIECGFAPRNLKKRLSNRYICPAEISAVLISHEHSDHVAGLSLIQNYDIPYYMSRGTARGLDFPRGWRCIEPLQSVVINELSVYAMPVPHDVNEPLQFVIDDGARRIVVFTDLGHVPRNVLHACQNADALVIECNYDEDMLRQGDYPEVVKERIKSDYGHLSNHDAARLITATQRNGKTRHIIGAHLSDKNNCPALVEKVLKSADERAMVHIADQQNGTDWIEI